MSGLAGRHIVSISDLSNGEIEGIFRLTDRFLSALQEGPLSIVRRRTRKRKTQRDTLAGVGRLCANQVLATVFFEPSTRTRLSFESAMNRLGGRVISMADPRTSSAAKGERLSDTIRMVASYADIVVLRHPNEGAALLATESLDEQRVAEIGRRVPIVNGGDGGHEHPTQTLCDLYTIKKEHGQIEGLSVALCGDLLHARTVHSLAYGLARFGAGLKCISPPSLRLPDYVKRRLKDDYDCVPEEYESFGDLVAPSQGQVPRAAARTRRRATKRLMEDADFLEAMGRFLDAVYVTRIQAERFTDPAEAEAVRGSYVIDPEVMRRIGKRTTILHPLPRVNEVDSAIDLDTRAAYFRQAAYGVPVRMALIALLLGRKRLRRTDDGGRAAGDAPAEEWITSVACRNDTCITNTERGMRARLAQVGDTGLLRCAYCDQEQETRGAMGGTK